MTSDLISLIGTVKALDATAQAESAAVHAFIIEHRLPNGTLPREVGREYVRLCEQSHAAKEEFEREAIDAAPRLALEVERLTQENARLRALSKALVDKLDTCNASIVAAFMIQKLHGMPYKGPSYHYEWEALRQFLAAHETKVE